MNEDLEAVVYDWYYRVDSEPLQVFSEKTIWKKYSLSDSIENSYLDYLYAKENDDADSFKLFIFKENGQEIHVDFSKGLQIKPQIILVGRFCDVNPNKDSKNLIFKEGEEPLWYYKIDSNTEIWTP